jgi:hypothetical protein
VRADRWLSNEVFSMLFRIISAVLFAIAVASTAAPRAIAAPVPILGELPLSDGDVRTLRTRLAFDELFETLDFLGSVSVFEHDASTPQRPIYYLAPFFSADTLLRRHAPGGHRWPGDRDKPAGAA